MEYLLSLVGKDQDTITEAITGLAQNGEKVKLQEKEIYDLKSELKDAKAEIKYLGNKLDKKYDLIEDMEHDIEKKEENFKEVEKEVALKEKHLKALENLVAEQVNEINILRENNFSMVSLIAENLQMEKEIKDLKEVIKELEEPTDYTSDRSYSVITL